MMSLMSVYFNAPFNDDQVAKLQNYQDTNPDAFVCRNGNCHSDPTKAPKLVATTGGLVCPDMNCASVVTSVPEYVIKGRFRF